MGMKYNEAEIRAVNEKREHPDKVVICPRCGAELMYREVGNSNDVLFS